MTGLTLVKKSPLIVTVLKNNPKDVYRVVDLFPDGEVYCLSDEILDDPIITLKLKYSWAGWWPEIELFRPDFQYDWIYFDLSSMVTLYLPVEQRAKVWKEWLMDPHGIMEDYDFLHWYDKLVSCKNRPHAYGDLY